MRAIVVNCSECSYGEQKAILSELVLIIIMVFPRILILVQNILIYLLEILNTILQGWRHCLLNMYTCILCISIYRYNNYINA